MSQKATTSLLSCNGDNRTTPIHVDLENHVAMVPAAALAAFAATERLIAAPDVCRTAVLTPSAARTPWSLVLSVL